MSQPSATRPTGVTIISLLAAVGGVFAILGAIGAFVVGTVLDSIAGDLGGSAIFSLGLLFAIGIGMIGIANLIFAVGAYRLRPWAWTMGVVLNAMSLVLNALPLTMGGQVDIVSIVVSGVIIFYLTRPEVRAAFGR